MAKSAEAAFRNSLFSNLSRRRAFAFAALLPAAAGVGSAAEEATTLSDPGPHFPRQDANLVRDVVGASHFDFEKVKALVSARPTLALAAWDWGFGDWETALGAASHVGRADIARFLMEHGARPDLFTHAMLGHLEIVRAVVEASPGIQRIKGPHGIPLLQHAVNTTKWKDAPPEVVARAKATAAYLESLGDAGTGNVSLETAATEAERYLGSYRFGKATNQVLHVRRNRMGRLTMEAKGQGAQILHRVEDHGFAPPGAPQVRIRFTVEDPAGSAIRVTIHDPQPVVVGSRI